MSRSPGRGADTAPARATASNGPGSPRPARDRDHGASFALDARGRVISWNDAATALYGFTAHEVIGRRPTMLVPPDLEVERDEAVREVLGGGYVPPFWTERMRKDGSRLEVAIELSGIHDSTGRVVGVQADVRDIAAPRADERRDHFDAAPSARIERSRRRLAEAQERFRTAFVHAPNGIALVSTAPSSEGSFLDVNPALARQLGYGTDDLLGRCLLDFLHPGAGDEPESLMGLLGADEADTRVERRFLRADGRDVWLEIGASVVRDDAGHPLYAVAHFQDVTAARRHQAELRHLADHDGLTGLVNRRCFGTRLESALSESRASGRSAAVLVVDLDDFKAVNDSCGHAAGDELLRRVAAALKSRVRSSDVVGRLGGDEFGILLTDVTPAKARRVAAELLAAVDREASVDSGPRRVRVTASIGVSTLDASSGSTAEALLSDADTAMYRAKKTGRNRLATSASPEPSPVHPARAVKRSRHRGGQGADIGPVARRFELWEQPLLNLSTGEHDRVELLARMRGRHGEEIPAGRFLPVLRRFGRVQEVDSWVLPAAVSLVARRQRAGLGGTVEINLDAASITDPRFVESIAVALTEASVDPRAITFGITAAASISDLDAAGRLMCSLTDLGCRFALDHFGASAGSLRDLKHLPFDVLKIDGELVAELPERRFDQLAVRAIVALASGGRLTTVAEHVSDDATIELLREYGVDYAQGFHVAVPRPATVAADGLAAVA